MKTNFIPCVNFTLLPANEGKFVNLADDPGGATNMGIDIDTLSDWLGRPATVDDVMNLSRDTAIAIYERNYWAPSGGMLLPVGIDLMTFDHGVNAGPATSVKLLQRLLRVRQDGMVGTETLTALNAHTVPWVISTLAMAQKGAYEADGRSEPDFLEGWLARLQRRHSTALSMAAS
jgi:lysozyme family protein